MFDRAKLRSGFEDTKFVFQARFARSLRGQRVPPPQKHLRLERYEKSLE
jgi:hypothetical protein